jgi:hypothetical protein
MASSIVESPAGGLIVRKAIGKEKDYGHTHRIWSSAFAVYFTIMITFFGKAHPDLHRALATF